MRKLKPPLQELTGVFAKFSVVQAVYLFGSVAGGTTHAGSDLDLAIIPQRSITSQEKLTILAELARAGFDNVDLLVLDTDDITLKYEAIRPNHLIYQTQEFDHGTMYSKVIRQYLDFQPYLEVQRAAYKRRLLHGQA